MKTALFVAMTAAVLVLPSLAKAQDAAAGEKLFQTRCATCHSFDAAAKKPGPSLAHIAGAKAAAAEGGFKFSPALTKSGLTWDDATLDEYLAAPTKKVPGSSMPVGVPNATERASLIAFLKTK